MADLNTTIEVIKQRLFDGADEFFPEMQFERKATKWVSPFHLDGTPSAKGSPVRTEIRQSHPFRIIEVDDGTSVSTFDFWAEKNGYNVRLVPSDVLEAAKHLCRLMGLKEPEGTPSKAAIKARKLEEIYEQYTAEARRILFEPEGKATLDYLHDVRGYNDDLIKEMGLGCVTYDLVEKYGFKAKNEGGDIYAGGLGSDYTLLAPITANGKIRGFQYRLTSNKTDVPKYKNNNGLEKSPHFIGLSAFKLTGNADKDRNVTIVEGTIDALHAQAVGVENVVASGGSSISKEAVEELKRRGAKFITILFDTESKPESQHNTDKKIDEACRIICEAGLKAFVARLPQEYEGQKVDVDDYLKTHSKEELEQHISDATTAAQDRYFRIWAQAIEGKESDENGKVALSPREAEEFVTNVVDMLAFSGLSTATDHTVILQWAATALGGQAVEYERALHKVIEKRDREARISRTDIALRKARTHFEEKEYGKVFEVIEEAKKEIVESSNEAKFADLITDENWDDFIRELKEEPEGVPTPYTFGEWDKKNARFKTGEEFNEKFVIPSGALTFIAAPTNHGKTSFMINLAIHAAQHESEGIVLYVSYEEATKDVNTQFINQLAGVKLSNNNRTTIKSYLKNGGDKTYFFRDSDEATREREQALAKGIEEYKRLKDGRLRVVRVDFNSGDLCDYIRYFNDKRKLKAVFVDYVQRINYGGDGRLQRYELLKGICDDLMNLSLDTGLPVVLGSQVNRDVKSPDQLRAQNMGEGSDIEKSANTIVMLWSSKRESFSGTKEAKLIGEHLEEMGISLGDEGKLYAVIEKSRVSRTGLEAVLDFDGSTGRITQSNPPATTQEQQPANSKGEEWAFNGDELPF